jgi:hypothetical protein
MALYRGQNFNPYNNYIISASGTSANQVVVQPTANTGAIAKDLLVYNSTTAVAYVAWGTTTQTAAH